MANAFSLDPKLATRARGTLLGLVAGNQLGVPTEQLGTAEAIREAFPHGVWDLPLPPKGSPYDDDAAMTLLLAESLAERPDFDAADVARRWVRWMKLDGRGLGVTTRNALRLIDRGVEPFEAGRRARELDPKWSAGNGAVMRCAPVAIRFHDNVDKLIRVSTQQAAITHADERCLWGAAAVNLAIRELLYGNIYFVDEVLHRLGDKAPRVLLDAIHRVLREEQADLPITVAGERGYVVHCVEIAFWFAAHDRTLEDTLVYLVQAGGDTDTNAAVAGALLGARYGEIALPQRWMAQLSGAQGILQLADRLLSPLTSRRSRELTAEG
ncbi:MAG: ADP-ribosylglycohydrolase family protein [Gemmatimonadetes bacterium]|nr:ADP-ribosylglycohydrolase family protein [Gemmatimonadota bacterium]